MSRAIFNKYRRPSSFPFGPLEAGRRSSAAVLLVYTRTAAVYTQEQAAFEVFNRQYVPTAVISSPMPVTEEESVASV